MLYLTIAQSVYHGQGSLVCMVDMVLSSFEIRELVLDFVDGDWEYDISFTPLTFYH